MNYRRIAMFGLISAGLLYFSGVANTGELRDYTLPSEKGYVSTPAQSAVSLSETDRKLTVKLQNAAPKLNAQQRQKLKAAYREKLSSAQQAEDRYAMTFYKQLLEILSNCQGEN